MRSVMGAGVRSPSYAAALVCTVISRTSLDRDHHSDTWMPIGTRT
ncbi:hypothetical protein OHS59_05775 [Streptomyces sp. NBC_00414]